MLSAGRLRHRIQIQRKAYTQDAVTGDMVPNWVNHVKVWAEIAPLSGREFIAANAEQSKVIARITIRQRNDVDATMRILHGGKFYNIEAVLPDKDSMLEYSTLPCSEGLRGEGPDVS